MPVLLSTPESADVPSMPFKFTGGFALSSKAIGAIFSFQGLYSMLAQLFLFPIIVRRFGNLKVFRFVALTYPFLYFSVPYLVLLKGRMRMIGLAICLLVKVTMGVLAYPSNAILLTNSAPSMLVLGTINGIAASIASLARALGPTISGMIHSTGLRMGYSGLAWWTGGLVCIVGAVESLWMAEVRGRLDQVDQTDEEAGQGISSSPVDAATATSDEFSVSSMAQSQDAPLILNIGLAVTTMDPSNQSAEGMMPSEPRMMSLGRR